MCSEKKNHWINVFLSVNFVRSRPMIDIFFQTSLGIFTVGKNEEYVNMKNL